MDTAIDLAAFDRGIDPVLDLLTQEQAKRIAGWRADESLHARVSELSAKANEGELTPEERAEYEGYIQANDFVTILQTQARRRLAGRRG